MATVEAHEREAVLRRIAWQWWFVGWAPVEAQKHEATSKLQKGHVTRVAEGCRPKQATIARASCKLQTHVQTNQTNQTHGIKHDMKFN